MKPSDVITDMTPFMRGLTIKEFCVKLEFCGLAAYKVEQMIGASRSAVWRKMQREPWKTYFAIKYPHKFGQKNAVPSVKKDYLAITEIPCMNGCGRMAKVEHEVGTKLPRGMRKRCSACANSIAGSGFHDNYRV